MGYLIWFDEFLWFLVVSGGLRNCRWVVLMGGVLNVFGYGYEMWSFFLYF